MSEQMRDGLAAAPICEHCWAWVSPAGAQGSARICMTCHTPDVDWLNEIEAEVNQVRTQRDEARAVLGAVAALVESWSKPAEGVTVGTDFELGRTVGIGVGVDDVLSDLRAVLAPVSGAVETAVQRCQRLHHLDYGYVMGCDECEAVSGAVEGAGDAATRERAFSDFDALHDHLLRLNEEGIPPDVSGYDRNGAPILAWLTEVGGDETFPLAATLDGSDDAATPAVEQRDAKDLAYPVLILDVSTPASPVAVHEQEVRADEVEPIGNATSLGPCTSICDAASHGTGPRSACFTPWCKCACHDRAAAARFAARTSGATE